MLNIDLLENLYDGLDNDKKQELMTLVFKKSRQTFSYFRRTKDVSLSKVEIIADYFHMPLDYFRINSAFKANNVAGNNNYVGNVSISTNLLIENQALKNELAALKETLRAKDESLKAKDMLIETLHSTNNKQ